MRKIKIAPSILAANPLQLAAEIEAVEKAGADWLHIDIMDGNFVPNINGSPEIVRCIKKITKLPLDIHLMVEEIDRIIPLFAEAGADRITIHPEVTYHPFRALQLIDYLGCQTGVALNPGTSPELVFPLLSKIDLILIMSVNPGFGGQEFIPDVLGKISFLREFIDEEEFPILLQVDGGITPQIAPEIIEAGADVLVAGTTIFKSKNYAKTIKALRSGSTK